jgi:hypothetical protein
VYGGHAHMVLWLRRVAQDAAETALWDTVLKKGQSCQSDVSAQVQSGNVP